MTRTGLPETDDYRTSAPRAGLGAHGLKLRRRPIEDRDLGAVADLLARGFPKRDRAYWRRGLDVLRTRRRPEGYPRYGLVLESEGRLGGVLLTIFAEVDIDGRRAVRCNLSSWHTEPEFRPYAALLLNAALKDKAVTYINVSPAPHTQPTIEAQGFRPFCQGSFLHLPKVSSIRGCARPLTPADLTPADLTALPECEMLGAHLALGCACFAVGPEREPFIFAPPRRLQGVLPSSQLLYCRSLETYAAHAGQLGWPLLKRGIAAVLVDTDDAIPGLRGRRINLDQNKYFFGPHPPQPGDLAYTELAIFRD